MALKMQFPFIRKLNKTRRLQMKKVLMFALALVITVAFVTTGFTQDKPAAPPDKPAAAPEKATKEKAPKEKKARKEKAAKKEKKEAAAPEKAAPATPATPPAPAKK
jgi:hypothetical protein